MSPGVSQFGKAGGVIFVVKRVFGDTILKLVSPLRLCAVLEATNCRVKLFVVECWVLVI